jgi:Zn-dependent protease
MDPGTGGGDGYSPFNPFYTPGGLHPEFYEHSEPVKTYGGRLRFSQQEIKELLIAFVFLSLALSILFSRWEILGGSAITMVGFTAAMLTVGTGFLLHEMAHKFSAQYFGCWSEFRASYRGLMFSVFTALAGFLLALPGAVEIRGDMDRRSYGLVSMAGPVTNILIVLIFSPFLFIFSGDALTIVQFVIFLNLILALFNTLPVNPLDGAKILDWDSTVYGIFAIAVLVVTLIIGPYANPL